MVLLKSRQCLIKPVLYRHQMVKTPQKPAGGSRHRTTPSPSNTSMDLSFKTPQNPSKSRVEHLQQQRCKSEPKAIMTGRGRSVTPPSLSSSPGPHFAMAKGIEPPTPTSLPRPPTNWTRSEQNRSVYQISTLFYFIYFGIFFLDLLY